MIGAGGLGSPALLYLAAAGVGTLGIVEFDEVDESNLQRQIIHGQSDIGQAEGESRRRSRSPRSTRYVNVIVHDERLDNDNVLGIFAALRPDRRRHRQLRHPLPGQRRRVLLGKPYVWGSIYRFDGQAIGLLGRARARATAASTPSPRRPAWSRRAPRAACSACSARRIGSIQVTEAIKLLTGIGEPLVGRLMIYDALEMEYRKLQGPQGPRLRDLRREPDRHRADRLRGVLRRDQRRGGRGRRRLDDQRDDPRATGSRSATTASGTSCWSTCASPTSTRSTRSPAAVLIPKGDFLDRRRRWPSCRSDKQVVLHCKTGVALGRGARGRSRAPASPTPSTSAAASRPGSTRSTPPSRPTDTSHSPGLRHAIRGPRSSRCMT